MARLSKAIRRPYNTYSIKKRHYGLRASAQREKAISCRFLALLIFERDDEEEEYTEEEENINDLLFLYFSHRYNCLTKWRDGPTDDIPKRILSIAVMSEQQCLSHFRFSKEQLCSLYVWLKVPEVFVLSDRSKILGESAMLCYFKSLSTWTRLVDLEHDIIGRDYTVISRCNKLFAKWLYITHGWRLTDNLAFWHPYFKSWNDAIRLKAFNCTGSDLPEHCQNVAIFLDATFKKICEPSVR